MAQHAGLKHKWPEGRRNPRFPARIEIHIRKADGSNLGEILFTENVCQNGLGLFAKRYWKPDEDVLLKSMRFGFKVRGQIRYCRRIGDRYYAVGVEVVSGEANWPS